MIDIKKTKERLVFERIKNICGSFDLIVFDLDQITYRVYPSRNLLENNLKHWDRVNGYVISSEFKNIVVSNGVCDSYGGKYLMFSMCGTTIRLHRLVSFLYYGDCIFGMEIDHEDGNRLNNSLSNLKVKTRKQNAENATKRKALNGVRYSGKLKRVDYVKIFKMLDDGCLHKNIASIFKVDVSTISAIKSRGIGYYLPPELVIGK